MGSDAAANVTRELARYLVSARPQDIPATVKKEVSRTLLNWVGVAVGGSGHETVTRALEAVTPFAGAAQAQIAGRTERLDIMNATLINGISSHVLDFDDTHLKTIIHASSAIVPPTLALAEYLPAISGVKFLHALTLGIETAFRVGNSVYPDHYDIGWHITGTAGSIGAAVAAATLLGLNEQQMIWALGLGASQQVGLRESFGSMNKSFNPGRAGQNGLLAALLAARNFTSSDQMIEAKRGWANTVSRKQDFREITSDLGTRFEAALNTYKPFACGIVIHPTIDGCIQLRNRHRLEAGSIARIELRVHPLVLELTGKRTPKSGLEGKFSVYHAAAVAIIEGRAGPRQFTDDAVSAPAAIALREKVTVVPDSAIKESQADVTITLANGERRRVMIVDAIGSVANPMSDNALEAKAADLMQGILPDARARAAIAVCRDIAHTPQASDLATLLRR